MEFAQNPVLKKKKNIYKILCLGIITPSISFHRTKNAESHLPQFFQARPWARDLSPLVNLGRATSFHSPVGHEPSGGKLVWTAEAYNKRKGSSSYYNKGFVALIAGKISPFAAICIWVMNVSHQENPDTQASFILLCNCV